jgi:hypothetical protein
MGQNPYSHLRFSVNEDALKDPEATTKIVWLFEMQAYGVELDPKDRVTLWCGPVQWPHDSLQMHQTLHNEAVTTDDMSVNWKNIGLLTSSQTATNSIPLSSFGPK